MPQRLRIPLLVGIGAALIGSAIGAISTIPTQRWQAGTEGARQVAAAAIGLRRRPPRPGDAWGGCDTARAAGTAPIYRGEPGYRADMDGDDDGIACEPVR